MAVGIQCEAVSKVAELGGDGRDRDALGDLDGGLAVTGVVRVPVDDPGRLAGPSDRALQRRDVKPTNTGRSAVRSSSGHMPVISSMTDVEPDRSEGN